MNRPAPTPDESLALHQRLLDGDPTASCDLCALYLPFLLLDLQQRFPLADPHLLQTAVHESLLSYLKQPHCYQPLRSDLSTYLRMAARSDVLNLQQRENRHLRGRIPKSVVDIDPPDGNSSPEGEPLLRLVRCEETLNMEYLVEQIRRNCTVQEQLVLDLLLAGVRNTGDYVTALRLDALSPTEQHRQIKHIKDRLKKRLLRGREHHD